MKKSLFVTILVSISLTCLTQGLTKEPLIEKDRYGGIKSVEFLQGIENSKIPSSPQDFFKEFLRIQAYDEFKIDPQTRKEENFIHEHFDQYYNGIKVEGGGYNFHYKSGKMFLAHGKYVKISNLNTVPNISSEQAKICFADYKMVPLKSITDYISDLIIKEILIDTLPKPLLVYKIYLYSDHKNNNISVHLNIIDFQLYTI